MIRIVSDSASSISQLEAKQLNIDIVPLYVLVDDKTYKDGVDIDYDEFYEILKTTQPTTSQPNPSDFSKIFEKYPEDKIICINSSDKLSGTYQSANIAKSMCENQEITIINSENISLGLKNLVLKATELRDKNFSYEEIISELNKLKNRVMMLGMVDKLDNLKRSGRISNVKFLAGSFLNLKPLLILKEGMLLPYHKKARGKQKAVSLMLESLNEYNYDENSKIIIGFSNNKENASLLSKALVKNDINNFYNDFTEIGSVIATHTGENTLVISFFSK